MNDFSRKFDENTLRYYKGVKKVSRFLRDYLYLICTLITLFLIFTSLIDGWNYFYRDCDGYMRAIRIKNFINNPGFWEQLIVESNYPFGEILHWTRPMDVLWLINMIPFLGMDNLNDAIFLAGAFIGPWLLVLTVIFLGYGLRKHFNIFLVLIGIFLFLMNHIVLGYFGFHIADHHSLCLCLEVYAFSLVLCWLKKRQDRYLMRLGFVLSLLMFTAIEGLLIYFVFLVFFVYLYIYKNIAIRTAKVISLYFALFTNLFWLINPPYQGWFYLDNGRISILFVTLGWLIYIGFYLIDRYKVHTKLYKIISLFCMGVGICLLLVLFFGIEVINPPLDVEIAKIWSHRISEMRSIYTMDWKKIYEEYSFIFISLLLNLYMFRYKKYKRLLSFNMIIGVIFVFFAMYAIRFMIYLIIITIVPYLVFIDYMYKKTEFYKSKKGDFPIEIWWLIIAIFLIQQISFINFSSINGKKNGEKPINYRYVYNQVKKEGGTVVSDVFLNGKLVFLSDVNVVGTSYHRNREGIIDNHKILYSTDDKELLALLLKHQVTQILLMDKQDMYYSTDIENKDKLFYRLIKRENIPEFLVEIPSVESNVFHYRVKI